MINFKELLETAGPEKLDYIVSIEGSPVWDYKIGGMHTVILISEDPWEGVEEEYVTLKELKKYVVNCEIPFDILELKTEADKETLKSFTWKEKELHLSHY